MNISLQHLSFGNRKTMIVSLNHPIFTAFRMRFSVSTSATKPLSAILDLTYSFDLVFTWLWPSWPGTAHDSTTPARSDDATKVTQLEKTKRQENNSADRIMTFVYIANDSRMITIMIIFSCYHCHYPSYLSFHPSLLSQQKSVLDITTINLSRPTSETSQPLQACLARLSMKTPSALAGMCSPTSMLMTQSKRLCRSTGSARSSDSIMPLLRTPMFAAPSQPEDKRAPNLIVSLLLLF